MCRYKIFVFFCMYVKIHMITLIANNAYGKSLCTILRHGASIVTPCYQWRFFLALLFPTIPVFSAPEGQRETVGNIEKHRCKWLHIRAGGNNVWPPNHWAYADVCVANGL